MIQQWRMFRFLEEEEGEEVKEEEKGKLDGDGRYGLKYFYT